MVMSKTAGADIAPAQLKKYYDIVMVLLLLIFCAAGYFFVKRYIRIKREYCYLSKINSPQEFREYLNANKSRMDVTYRIKMCSEKALGAIHVKKFSQAREYLQIILSECDTEQLRQDTVYAIAITYFHENNLPMAEKYAMEIISAKTRIPLYYNDALNLLELVRKAKKNE